MAVRLDASGEDFTRALGLGSLTALTACCWVKVSVDRNTWSSAFFVDNGQTDNWGIQTGSDGTTINAVMDGNSTASVAMTAGTWYFIALATSGATGTIYYKAAGTSTLSTTAVTGVTATTATTLRLGESPWGGEWLNGCLAGFRLWTAQLSAAEIQLESMQQVPNRHTNLVSWHPLVRTETTDYSGNARTLSGGTGTTTEDGPPIPWRLISPRLILPTAAGGTITGVATGTFGFTSTANGVDRALGSASTSLGFTGTASGVPRTPGTATGSFGFTAATSGTTSSPPVTGAASGSFQFTATTQGFPTTRGAAAGSFGFTASASGVDRSIGSAATTFGFAATSQGVDRAVGSAAAPLGFTATTSGKVTVRGGAAGSFGFTATGAGFAGTPPVTGSGSAQFGFTATSQGVDRAVGSATANIGFTASTSGRPRVVGQATAVLGWGGSSAGVRRVRGSTAGSFVFSAPVLGVGRGPTVFGTAHAASGPAPSAVLAASATATATPGSMTVPTATGG